VDVLFPEDQGRERRRAALLKVMNWFGNDLSAVFDAQAEIAVIDQRQGRAEESIRDLQELLERHAGEVDDERRAWAEYLLADALRLTGRTHEAQEIYDRLSRMPDLSVNRRGWAYARAAFVRRNSAPLEALAILEEGKQLDSAALPQQVVLLVRLLSELFSPEAVNDRLDSIDRRHPHRILEIHERLTDEVTGYLDEGEIRQAERLVELLLARIEANPDLSFFSDRTARLRKLVRDSTSCREIAGRIEAYFRSRSPEWWAGDGSDLQGEDRETLIAILEQLDRTGRARDFVRVSVEVVTRFNVAPDFFGFILFRCADHLHAADCDPELRDRFLDWCDQLPESNRFRYAASTLRESIAERNREQE
jgi:hypothetical protein